MRLTSRYLVIYASVMAISIAASVVAAVSAQRSLPDVAVPAGPVVVDVGDAVNLDRRTVGVVERTLGPRSLVTFAGETGTITEVLVNRGAVVSELDGVVRVDNYAVLARRGMPFYRDLVLGDSGPDVTDAQEILFELGLLDIEPDGSFGRGSRNAANDLALSLGFTSAQNTVRREWFATLPASSAVVSEVLVEPGDRVVEGDPLLRIVPPGTTHVLYDSDGEPVDLGQGWILEFEDGTALTVETRADVSEFLGLAPTLFNEEGFAQVSLRLAQPIRGIAVPASAVVAHLDGFCVATSESGTTVDVEIVGSGPGTSYVRSEQTLTSVLSNPASDVPCR